MHFNVTTYAGAGINDIRENSVRVRGMIEQNDMQQVLSDIGVEYRAADYFPTREVVIIIRPVQPTPPAPDLSSVTRHVRDAARELGLELGE